jgi:hypothetical protein
VPSGIRASGELCQQTRLPDTRLADEQGRRRASRLELGEEAIERTQLLGAPDEVVGLQGHVSFLSRINQVAGPKNQGQGSG